MIGLLVALALITGTPQADRIRGTLEADRIYAKAGNDRIRPGAGVDEIWCGPGRDAVYVTFIDDIYHQCEAVVYSPP